MLRSHSSRRGEATPESDDVLGRLLYRRWRAARGALPLPPFDMIYALLFLAVDKTVDRSGNLIDARTAAATACARAAALRAEIGAKIRLKFQRILDSDIVFAGLPINGCYDHTPPVVAKPLRRVTTF